jgi:hypothetical protein
MNRFKLNATWCVKRVFAVKTKATVALASQFPSCPSSASAGIFPAKHRILVILQRCRETIPSVTLGRTSPMSRVSLQLKPSKTCAGRAILAGPHEPRLIYGSRFLRISPALVVCRKNRPGLQSASLRWGWIRRTAGAISRTLTTHSILGIHVGRRETCWTVWQRTGNPRGVGLSVKNPS